MKLVLKKVNLIAKILLAVVMVTCLEVKPNTVVLAAQNSNLNKKLDLNSYSLVDTTTAGYEKPSYLAQNTPVEQEKQEVSAPVVADPVLKSYNAKMTGYVYNCPKCSGRLACDSSLDLSNGKTDYYDIKYGNIRIVASSKNLKCGSIVSIKSKISNDPIIAIVLDRGVTGTKLDLLMESEDAARSQIGVKDITYDVLREGY